MTRLRKIMLEELQRRNYSQGTVRGYVAAVQANAQAFQSATGPTHPEAAEAMKQPPFEVADIIGAHRSRFIDKNRSWLTWLHLRVLHAIEHCRTAALGGHRHQCPECGHRAILFHS